MFQTESKRLRQMRAWWFNAHACPGNCVVEFYPSRTEDVEANALDCGRARAELGWKSKIALTDGLNMTLEWIDAVGALMP